MTSRLRLTVYTFAEDRRLEIGQAELERPAGNPGSPILHVELDSLPVSGRLFVLLGEVDIAEVWSAGRRDVSYIDRLNRHIAEQKHTADTHPDALVRHTAQARADTYQCALDDFKKAMTER